MKKLKKNVFEAPLTADEAEKIVKKFAKEELLIMRIDRKRKDQIRKRAAAAGVSMAAYLLLAEDFFAGAKAGR